MENTLEKIYKSSINFLLPLSLEETYEKIVSEAVFLTGTKWGSIFLNQKGKLVRVYSTVPQTIKGKPRRSGFTYKAFKTGKIHILSGKNIKKNHPMYKKAKAIVFIPLYFENEPRGVLNLISNEEIVLGVNNFHPLQLFGTMVSLSIRKAQLFSDTEDAIKNRDFFISTASHELRTPLTSIYIYAQLLEKKLARGPETEAILSKNLNLQVKRLIRLTNELLDVNLAKTGSLKYFMKKRSLRKIVQRAILDTRLVYPDYEFIINFDDEENTYEVIGDFDRLVQVILNILSNAAKFSSTKSLIEISVASEKPYIVLIVKDKGKGIHKRDQKNIFEIFYKGDSRRQGMGMGLYLVKRIIDRHEGSIEIDSKLNKGTTVTIKLLESKYNGKATKNS